MIFLAVIIGHCWHCIFFFSTTASTVKMCPQVTLPTKENVPVMREKKEIEETSLLTSRIHCTRGSEWIELNEAKL